MKFVPSKIIGCYNIFPDFHCDLRGTLVKTLHANTFEDAGLCYTFKEQYYSKSNKGVVRGLHFQTPPYDHAKLIYCIVGEVMDACVDLRLGSPTYGKNYCTTLSANKGNMIYIPQGVAHGFCTTNEAATLVYNVTTVYNPSYDAGIRWDTAGISWPVDEPHMSDRDLNLPTLSDFVSPFIFNADVK